LFVFNDTIEAHIKLQLIDLAAQFRIYIEGLGCFNLVLVQA
jgi:hypothetical protein